MPRNPPDATPSELPNEGKRLWRATIRQMKRQGTWVDTDAALTEQYVWAVLTAREARAGGDHKLAGESARDAHRYASALLLTPEARKRHGIEPRLSSNGSAARLGLVESSSSATIVEGGTSGAIIA